MNAYDRLVVPGEDSNPGPGTPSEQRDLFCKLCGEPIGIRPAYREIEKEHCYECQIRMGGPK